ncbi:MAG: type II secretion system F family protein [Planctomycetaceae bacterium]
MFRNPDLPWATLASFAHALGRLTDAGVDLRKALQTAGQRASGARLASATASIRKAVAGGSTLTEALAAQGELFPPLFRDLVHVGELTGHMPEVFQALATYYEARIEQLRQFRSAIAWPLIQFIVAIGIVGLLIFILGLLPPAGPDGRPWDVTGLGLYGSTGALLWFIAWGLMATGGWCFWKFSRNRLAAAQTLDALLLQIPVLGPCIAAFAVSRFAWCFSLTQKAGMSIRPSLDASFRAAENGAFSAAAPFVWNDVADGETLADAFRNARVFPEEFLQVVATAEETGTVPEQLHRLSHIFEDQARRSMRRLTAVFSGAVWLFTGGLIVYFIMRLALLYVGVIQDGLNNI